MKRDEIEKRVDKMYIPHEARSLDGIINIPRKEVVDLIQELLKEERDKMVEAFMEVFGEDWEFLRATYVEEKDKNMTKDAIELKQSLVRFRDKYLSKLPEGEDDE